MTKITVLPIHMWDRELDSRILYASLLADLGEHVLLGHEYNVSPIYTEFDGIYYYGAGIPVFCPTRTINWFQPIIQNDGFVSLNFEEGINNMLSDETASKRYEGFTDESINFFSEFYPWSDRDNSQFLTNLPSRYVEASHKVLVGSNPRLDLLSASGKSYFTRRTRAISVAYGDYILISDNFAIEKYGTTWPRKNTRHLRKVRNKFLEIINLLVKEHPSLTFILRPHPVGDSRFWHNNLVPARNLQVIYNDCVDPWIHSCSAVLHSACTVGLQAELAGVPSIDLSLICNDYRSRSVSSLCSKFKPKSMSVLANNIATCMINSPDQNNILINYESRNEPILRLHPDVLNMIKKKADISFPAFSALEFLVERYKLYRSKHSSSESLNGTSLNSICYNSHPPNPNKSRHYSLRDIRDRVTDACSVLNISPGIQVTQVGINLFSIARANK